MARKCENLIGQKFGMLTVIEPAGADAHGNKKWLCLCECGKKIVVLALNLKRGHTVSCGCKRENDLTGKKIGRLTVIKRSDKYGSRGTRQTQLWECLCDCGNITYKATDTLTNNEISMCADCATAYASSRMRDGAGYVDGTQISRIKSDKLIATNTSGVRGVYWDRRMGKWRARLKFKGKLMNFGSYTNFEDAVRARKQAEEEYFGEFLDSIQS